MCNYWTWTGTRQAAPEWLWQRYFLAKDDVEGPRKPFAHCWSSNGFTVGIMESYFFTSRKTNQQCAIYDELLCNMQQCQWKTFKPSIHLRQFNLLLIASWSIMNLQRTLVFFIHQRLWVYIVWEILIFRFTVEAKGRCRRIWGPSQLNSCAVTWKTEISLHSVVPGLTIQRAISQRAAASLLKYFQLGIMNSLNCGIEFIVP